MSQDLTFVFRKENESFVSHNFSTTLARKITNESIIIKYTEDYIELNKNDIENIIQEINEQIDDCQSYINKYSEVNDCFKQLVHNTTAPDVYQEIKKDILDNKDCIQELNDEIDIWLNTKNIMRNLSNMIIYNSDWKLYYINC